MAKLQDLIAQVSDPVLRERLTEEAGRLLRQKKFGLVFEEHLPECTPLYDIPIRVGQTVALKAGYVSDIYEELKIDGSDVYCDRKETHERKTFKLDELVAVAEFGEPIYPYLKPMGEVCNAPDSELWHTLIEADNYHALQLLEYLYAGKVDCIYIDPPYNTGAKDWKYNNDYVDGSDTYRHSKWLSMMEKRLKLAKKLLNPNDSVLIVTIDEKEYLEFIDLKQDEFYRLLKDDTSITTSMPCAGDVMDKWDELLKEYDEVVYIPMSSGLSSSCQTAMMLAEDYEDKVQVVDNQRISVTMRLSAVEAKKLADEGKNAKEIKDYLESTKMESTIDRKSVV